jgi:hypothetical protein
MKLKKGVPLPIQGLNTSAPGEYIDPRSTPDCSNMELNRSVIRKRLGTISLGASLSERVMAYSQLQLQSTIYVVRVGLTKVEVLNQSTRTWSSIASSVLTGSSTDRFDFAFPLLSGVKIMVFTNGLDAIRKFTGSGNDASLGGSPPKSLYCLAFRGYLLLAYVTSGGTTYPSRVQWSDTGAPETWGSGNAGSVDLVQDEQDITGMEPFGDFVAVHKSNSIYVGYLVTTSDVFRFDRKATGVGAVARDSIKTLPTGEQAFLAGDGIHLFNGVTAPLLQSPIMDEMREQMNPQYISASVAVVVRELDEYWIAVPIGNDTTPSTIYKYNYRTGQVYKDTRTNLTAMSSYIKTTQLTWADKTGSWDSDITRWNDAINSTLNPTIIFGDSSGNTTERSAVNNDNGTAISSYWVSKDFTIADLDKDEMGRLVRWTAVQIWAKGSTVAVEYSTDNGVSWTSIITLTLASTYPTDSAPLYGYFDVLSTQIRFRFSNAVAGESFTLEKFIIDASPREIRQ